MDRDTCVFETLDDRRNEFDSKHIAVVQLEPGVSALRKAGWSAKFDYQPYQSGGHKGTGGLRIWVGVQSNPAATTSPTATGEGNPARRPSSVWLLQRHRHSAQH